MAAGESASAKDWREECDEDDEEVYGEECDAHFFGLGRSKKPDQDDAIGLIRQPQHLAAAERQARLASRVPKPPKPRFPFDDSEYFYKMSNPRRGIALVLNYERFSPDRHDYASTRRGSSVDADHLVATFRHLKFDVRRFDNLRTSETLSVLREIALADHSVNDCLIVAVLSHGDQGPSGETVFFTYDKTLRITDDLVTRFSGSRCESLRAKPKLFFVQACQGSRTDQGVYVQIHDTNGNCSNGNGNGAVSTFRAPRTVHLPDEADILIAYSTPPGYYSWRNETEGSWFVNELCSSLGRWAYDLDIVRILTRVCHNVAVGYASRSTDPRLTNMKQCPTYVSRLTKELKFPPPDENDGETD